MIVQYEKTFQGAHRFYALDKNGHLFERDYLFYTKREALCLFKLQLKDLNLKESDK